MTPAKRRRVSTRDRAPQAVRLFYTTATKGNRRVFLVGPFLTRTEADAAITDVAMYSAIQLGLGFSGYGATAVTSTQHQAGRLNLATGYDCSRLLKACSV